MSYENVVDREDYGVGDQVFKGLDSLLVFGFCLLITCSSLNTVSHKISLIPSSHRISF